MSDIAFEPKRELRIHQAFEVGVILKGINAILQIVLGLALLVSTRFNDVLIALVQNELIEDPGDFFARNMDRISPYFTPHFEFYAALYMLSHGIVKAVLVWGLLRNKMWAYPASLGVLALFILYQIIKIAENHSILLILLTVFDLAVMWLIWHEYRYVREKAATNV